MSNKGKSIATESDCESCGSNSLATTSVCNPGPISLKRGRDKLVERDAENIFFHLVNPKRRSMQCSCVARLANRAVLWSLRQHRLQPYLGSLPSSYRNYSFWESVAGLANKKFGLQLNVKSALGLAAEMKELGCSCGEVQLVFSNAIDYGPVIVPQFSELIGGVPSAFISDEVLPYVNNFVDASPSHTYILDPQVNHIAEVSTSQALVTSIPSEPGPTTKKRKATFGELQSLLMNCPNLPRPTIYAAMANFKCKAARSVWINDSLMHKLDFLEGLTPRKSLRDFIHWRSTQEAWSLQ